MYRIHLKEFEGPLDLLLFFIKRDEINIYNIPISKITEEFLAYLSAMKELDLEVAADFIYMASMLISIKAKMLLPSTVVDTSEIEDYDPRTELVERLLEYKQMKEASLQMRFQEEERRHLFERRHFDMLPMVDIVERKVSLFDLIQAYLNAVEKAKNRTIHTVQRFPVTLEEQSDVVLNILKEKERFSFFEIVERYPVKIYIVVTFLAVLELAKNNLVSIVVDDNNHHDFWVALPVRG